MTEKPAVLRKPAFVSLPLGAIIPAGWLRDQLRTQADGLTGHLDEFWPDVADSGWRGGSAEGWERAPYWLDGLVPIAFLLDDERLKAKATGWIDAILERQQEDGWFGDVYDRQVGDPARVRPGGSAYNAIAYDPWPRFILLKVLIQYHEATGDFRILPAILRFMRRLDAVLETSVLRSWARFRWADLVVACHWLYDQTGEAWLLDLAARAHDQGFDWRRHFERFPFHEKLTGSECDLSSHGPNNAMGIKAGGVWFRQSGDDGDRLATYHAISELDRYHGQATGMFSCDEHLAGRSPSQGSELCAVVEYMYSLEVLVSVLGDIDFADLLESLAFNALPATISPDMWTHQYDQQVNQPFCKADIDRVYTTNGPDANLFGLEPHFGCCTANMHQGWPKLASSAWMRSPDGGLAAITYVPCDIRCEVDGAPVRIVVETGYPFEDQVRIAITSEVNIPLSLRIPAWATSATVSVGDGAAQAVPAGRFHILSVEGGSSIVLDFNPAFRIVPRDRGAVAIRRGPLLYGLRIDESWRMVVERDTVSDFEIDPLSAWNYALAIDPDDPDAGLDLTVGSMGERPFSPDGSPHQVTAQAVKVAEWGVAHNAAGPVPMSPVDAGLDVERVTLIPYGCTNIRMAEFPLVSHGNWVSSRNSS